MLYQEKCFIVHVSLMKKQTPKGFNNLPQVMHDLSNSESSFHGKLVMPCCKWPKTVQLYTTSCSSAKVILLFMSFKTNYIYLICKSVHMYVCVPRGSSVHTGKKKALDPLGLQLQMIVRIVSLSVLRIDPESSGREPVVFI